MSKSDCAERGVFSRRDLLRSVAAGAALFGLSRSFENGLCKASVPLDKAGANGSLPNIIFILADDLGWHELGCYGNTYNETPNLDTLAAGGIKFTDGYAAGPVCSPTRASIMAAQYPARTGILKWIEKTDLTRRLARNYITIAEILKSKGYATGIVGKWHLSAYAADGCTNPVPPEQQGFDENLAGATTSIGNGDYWIGHNGTGDTNYWIMPALPKLPFSLDPKLPAGQEYLVDRCNYEGLDFIERHKDQPFFLYLSHYAVHTELSGKDYLLSRFTSKPGSGSTDPSSKPNNPHLAAQLFTIDEGVGKIVTKLNQHGLLNNTIIVFMGDNGGSGDVTNNGPLRAGKGNCYEGGIRVPFIMSWPGHIQPGVSSEPVVSCDFYPTFSEIVNAQLPAGQTMDGVSLVPLFTNPQGTLNRDALYWYYPFNNQAAIRKRDWKLYERLDTGLIELYNIANDLSETTDLKYQYPGKTTELYNDLKAWRSSIPRFADSNASGHVDMQELTNLAQNWLR